MREIKFRAWDEKEKCWVSGFSIHQSGMFSDWAGCKQVNGMCIADANWQYSNEIPHIKIMQYTGLKDRSGKEIYEGDILRMDDGVKNQFVKWSDWMAGFVMVLSDTSGSTDIPSNCEVIGNIHEHPHLLEVETT